MKSFMVKIIVFRMNFIAENAFHHQMVISLQNVITKNTSWCLNLVMYEKISLPNLGDSRSISKILLPKIWQ